METHDKLVSAIIKECDRLDKKQKNICRLGIYLEGLEYAENHPKGIAHGIGQAFLGGIRSKLLKIVGADPEKVKESNGWCREEY